MSSTAPATATASDKGGSSAPADAPPPLAPHSTLACQVEATNAWRRDLRALYSRSAERFPDVCWQASDDDTKIWGHKAILYSRAPNTFQARYLHLRTPTANLGALASSSTVSLPSIRAPSPGPSLRSEIFNRRSAKVRGNAPPSSFSMARTVSGSSSGDEGGDGVRKTPSTSSLSSVGLSISRPMSRDSVTSARNSVSMARSDNTGESSARSSFSTNRDSDTLSIGASSVLSSASTVRAAPLPLGDVSPAFFEATLEYLYTAEESMVEAFEFLYEDRMAPAGRPEEGLEKLRQDFVFMWRSRLYSDVRIVLGDGDPDEAAPGTIPDVDNASVISMAVSLPATVTDGGHGDEENTEGPAVFSTHRMILVSRSPYFATQLLGPYADAHATVLRLPSPPFTPASLHFTLGFLYTGTLFFSNRSFDLATAFQLWRAGAYLQVETLQTLVSSLIAADFCHGFACAPPCRTCLKRVPRALAFASAPDVGDETLRGQARRAVSGPHFGVYWFKDVGQLDYAARGALVADVCARVDAKPAQALAVLGQLATVGARIDRERASAWVDALRWMCESVEAHVRASLEPNLEAVIASREWADLLDGVGFSHDILEKALLLLLDGLNERRAAHVYQVLVGQVLLRDEGPPLEGPPRQLVDDARESVLRYLKKRWIGVRSQGGFNELDNWALKELSHELDVPAADLMLPEGQVLPEAPLSRTGLRAAVPASKRPAVPVAPEEREAGPVNMRAAVLNRAAARSSANNGFRSGTQPAAAAAAAAAPVAAPSVMNRARGAPAPSSTASSIASRTASSVASTVSRPATAASTASTSNSRASSVASVRRAPAPASTAATRTAAARTAAATASRAGASTSASRPPAASAGLAVPAARRGSTASNSSANGSTAARSTGARTPTGSLRSVRSRLNSDASTAAASPPRSPTRSTTSTLDERTRTPTASRILQTASQVTPRAARPTAAPASNAAPSMRTVRSNASIRSAASSVSATPRAAAPPAPRHTFLKATPRPPGQAPSSGTRARLSSNASVASVASTTGPKRAPSAPSLTSAASAQRAAVSKPAPAPAPGKPKVAQSPAVAAAAAVAARSRVGSGASAGRAPAASAAAVPPFPVAAEPTAAPPATAERAATSEATPMDVDVEPPSASTLVASSQDTHADPPAGTSLAHGIPCIVSPRRSTRFRAVVKYIGPLPGESGAWVGVEVPVPLPRGLEGLAFNDGTVGGRRFFELSGAREEEHAKHTPEREARRRRIARIVARGAAVGDVAAEDHDAPLPSAGEEGGAPNAKRRKDLSGGLANGNKENVACRGLFLRPVDVLWVVT